MENIGCHQKSKHLIWLSGLRAQVSPMFHASSFFLSWRGWVQKPKMNPLSSLQMTLTSSLRASAWGPALALHILPHRHKDNSFGLPHQTRMKVSPVSGKNKKTLQHPSSSISIYQSACQFTKVNRKPQLGDSFIHLFNKILQRIPLV